MAASAEEKIIPARGKALVDTQISIAVPVGTYGRVAPRSGLGAWQSNVESDPLVHFRLFYVLAASKFMIDTGAGVIDADYRGVVFVLLFNYSDQDFTGETRPRVVHSVDEANLSFQFNRETGLRN